ncbi:MAG: alkaline phosphatase family protein [Gemmatimonadota bacterium]
MPTTRKILVLALDAATPALLERWTADGTLPNIANAMANGLVSPAMGVEGMEVGSTWPSFYTGLNPAGHGICWSDRVIPGTYRQLRLNPRDFAGITPFWERLSDAGKRVIVLDIPFAPLAPRLNGVHVVEWGVHDGAFGYRTTPASLAASLRARYGIHPPPTTCDTDRLDAAGHRELRDKMVRGVELRGQMTRDLLATHEWDFALQCFNEIHCSGHIFWHYHDPTHPAHDAATVARDGDLLRDVYIATDREIGALMEQVGPDTTVILMTLHSMEHTCGSSLLLPAMLERLGVCATATGRSLADVRPVDAPIVPVGKGRGLKGLARTLVPEGIRLRLYAVRQWFNKQVLHTGEPIDIDPSRTKAFQMGFGAGSTYSGIRFNLKGREPEGIVEPGEGERELTELLQRELLATVNPETGRPLVRRVVRTADIHQGRLLHELPDLLVEWEYDVGRGNTIVGNGEGSVWRGYSDRIGSVEHPNGGGRTGAHRLEGMIITTGPGIEPGHSSRVVNCVDMAPTLMAMHGVAFGPNDGRVVEDWMTHAG